MTTQEILKLCGKGEQTPVQLKERVVDNYEVGKEMVCYANERSGGTIIIGVNDKTGEINALSMLFHVWKFKSRQACFPRLQSRT